MYLDDILVSYLNIEKCLLSLKNKYPELRFDLPWQQETLIEKLISLGVDRESALRFALNPMLTEDKNFPTPTDIGVYLSPRFLPAVWHSHSYIEIICVLHGECKNYLRSEVFKLQKGDIFIIAPETSHAISSFNKDALVLNITVRSSTFADTFNNLLKSDDVLAGFFQTVLYGEPGNSYLLFKTYGDPVATNYIKDMFYEFRAENKYKKRMLNAQFTQLAIHLLRCHEDSIITAGKTKRDIDPIQDILRYIKTHYHELTLEDLSEHFGYSVRHMGRIIKKHTGFTFSSLVQSIKLSKATRLIIDEKYSIREATFAAGYNSINSFYRDFKKKYQTTPSKYLEKLSSSR